MYIDWSFNFAWTPLASIFLEVGLADTKYTSINIGLYVYLKKWITQCLSLFYEGEIVPTISVGYYVSICGPVGIAC